MRVYYVSFLFFALSAKALSQPLTDTLISAESPKDTPTISPLTGTVTFTTLLNAMENAKGWTVFQNIKVRFDHKIDKGIGGMDYVWDKKTKIFNFTAAHIGLYNVDFDEEYWLVLRNAVFDCQLSFINCTSVKFWFIGCKFTRAVRLHSNKFEFALFDKCNFSGGFRFTRGEVSDYIKFVNSDFSFSDDNIGRGGGFDMDDRLFLFSNKIDGIDLTIDSCRFASNSKIGVAKSAIDLSESKFKNLVISNSQSNAALNLESSVIDNLINIENNKNDVGFLFKGVGLNPNNTFIDWVAFSDGRLLIFDRQKTTILNKDSIEYLFQNKELYNQLISSYALIFNTYKAEGNRESANACYIEWKDLETQYTLKNNNRFRYAINRFLKVFCDYGTSITKPLLFSFRVILVFAFIYFLIFLFYTSTLDLLRSQAKFLLDFYNKIQTKEAYPSTLVISAHENEKQKLLNYARQKNYRVSYFIKALIFSVSFSTFSNNLFRNIFYFLRRIHLSKINKRSRGIIFKVSIWIFKSVFLFTILFQLFAEAFFLSLNAFTTLGFGEFKVSGRLIYLTIIQGFIGWLLLSIFTAALINQIINW